MFFHTDPVSTVIDPVSAMIDLVSAVIDLVSAMKSPPEWKQCGLKLSIGKFNAFGVAIQHA